MLWCYYHPRRGHGRQNTSHTVRLCKPQVFASSHWHHTLTITPLHDNSSFWKSLVQSSKFQRLLRCVSWWSDWTICDVSGRTYSTSSGHHRVISGMDYVSGELSFPSEPKVWSVMSPNKWPSTQMFRRKFRALLASQACACHGKKITPRHMRVGRRNVVNRKKANRNEGDNLDWNKGSRSLWQGIRRKPRHITKPSRVWRLVKSNCVGCVFSLIAMFSSLF